MIVTQQSNQLHAMSAHSDEAGRFAMFPDQEAARVYMEGKRWPDGAVCPGCNEPKRITTRKGGFYRCNACKEDFTVRTGTIFERSHVPLHKWLAALAIVVDRPDIASYDLGEAIGVTQKTGWFVLHRLREACGSEIEKLQGIVEKAPDALVDKVLAFRPKPKSKAGKARKLRKAKIMALSPAILAIDS